MVGGRSGRFSSSVGHFWYVHGGRYVRFFSTTNDIKCFIFLFIAAEFGFYVVIRQLVNTKEWITACKSQTVIYLPHISYASREG